MNALAPPDHPATIDAGLFKATFRRLVGGVSVITTGSGANRTGLTATSVSALSAEPPTLTVNINRTSSTWDVLAREGRFGVNFIGADQKAVAERFSGFGGLKGADRYQGADWTTALTGAPLLVGALAALDCEVEEAIERHSHVILIGRIRATLLGDGTGALLYGEGGYRLTQPVA
ncbi:flavin reductase family protein [Segnochrobactraceae bacterium EtOH-i3]